MSDAWIIELKRRTYWIYHHFASLVCLFVASCGIVETKSMEEFYFFVRSRIQDDVCSYTLWSLRVWMIPVLVRLLMFVMFEHRTKWQYAPWITWKKINFSFYRCSNRIWNAKMEFGNNKLIFSSCDTDKCLLAPIQSVQSNFAIYEINGHLSSQLTFAFCLASNFN